MSDCVFVYIIGCVCVCVCVCVRVCVFVCVYLYVIISIAEMSDNEGGGRNARMTCLWKSFASSSKHFSLFTSLPSTTASSNACKPHIRHTLPNLIDTFLNYHIFSLSNLFHYKIFFTIMIPRYHSLPMRHHYEAFDPNDF